MSFYTPVKGAKSAGNFIDYEKDSDVILEADIDLYPNSKYQAGLSYRTSGLGSIFDGVYNFSSVTHIINREGYSVSAKSRRTLVKYSPPTKKEDSKPATAKTESKREITHKVVKGDTLWEILEKYKRKPTKYNELARYNNIKNPHLIYPGQIIKIPASI